MTRSVVLQFCTVLKAIAEHLAETRGVDRHDVESCRRRITEACAGYDQYVSAAALCGALHCELSIIDRARPGLPLR